MDNKSKHLLIPIGNEPTPKSDEHAFMDKSLTRIDVASTARSESRTPSSRRPSSEALSVSHFPRSSTFRYHLLIKDDLRGVDSRSQRANLGTKRARSGSTDVEDSSSEPKLKRDKLLQELDNLAACSHSETGSRHETGGSAAHVTSIQFRDDTIVAGQGLKPPTRSLTEDDQQAEMDNGLSSSSTMPDKDENRHPDA